MIAYFINLDRSPGRRRFMEHQFQKAGILSERVPAIDGQNLVVTHEIAHVERLTDWGFLLTSNAIGCALSHVAAYRRFLQTEAKMALFFEDDITLCENFAAIAANCAEELPEGAVALFYFHGDTKLFRSESAIMLAGGRSLMRAENPGAAFSAGAYMIGRETARKIADFNTPVYTTTDSWGLFMHKGLISGLYAVIPPVTSPAYFSSDIGYSKAGKFLRRIERLSGDRLTPLLSRLRKRRRSIMRYKIV
jgi:GR25 family glycosyltransferase involved in LPS biosynthesis